MTRPVAVRGIGTTAFTRNQGVDAAALAGEAVVDAVRDAGLHPTDIDAAFVGHVKQGPAFGQRVLIRDLGRSGLPVVNVENVCASSSTAMWLAAQALREGSFTNVLVVGADVLSSEGGTLALDSADYNEVQGIPLPVSYALKAETYARKFDIDPDDFAAVAVKNRRNSSRNPNALWRTEVSRSEVLESRSIAGPLTLLQCSANADGASAAVLTTSPNDRSVEVAAIALRGGSHFGSTDSELFDVSAVAAKAAREAARISVDDIDVIECHDAFSCGEVFHYESLGLCGAGEGIHLVKKGETTIGGGIPVNPSGGLIGRGHPIGATGIVQIVELVRQLRGQAGELQVERAETALAHTMGGGMYGIDGAAACTISILRA